jgi:Na+/H+-dicarboxylate symporter
MKNKAFKKTFYGGFILFSFITLLGILLGLNIYYFVTPKIENLFKKEDIVVQIEPIDSSFMENNTPFEVITKPVHKSIDTPKVKPEIKNSPTPVTKKVQDTIVSQDTII